MGKIVVFENVSLDGVTQDPTGEEGFSAADWRAALSPDDRAAWARLIHDDVLDAQALLLGRRSYEYFAARYPRRTGATADRMNGMPKYVVSATLSDPEWNNTTVLRGDLTEQVSKLRYLVDGEIRVYASTELVHALLASGLVDVLRLAVFPVLVGAGSRLFEHGDDALPVTPRPLRLTGIRPVGAGLAHLTYAVARASSAESDRGLRCRWRRVAFRS
ncbi:dihydrofolate reductase family protein [Nocardia aobensis]|uniref:Dihydrofolate reductase family protein n=1 Tax=Nocardia aobensis TaxID=257277 RepID=A0ABW6P644_9NOCA